MRLELIDVLLFAVDHLLEELPSIEVAHLRAMRHRRAQLLDRA